MGMYGDNFECTDVNLHSRRAHLSSECHLVCLAASHIYRSTLQFLLRTIFLFFSLRNCKFWLPRKNVRTSIGLREFLRSSVGAFGFEKKKNKTREKFFCNSVALGALIVGVKGFLPPGQKGVLFNHTT